ncbi:MAG: aconitase X catalytic domain-containing protein [Candidatus Altiarchaeota archaeon]|nr:aconitase X catalytic domain-containing protein [Candidatus Altiarchaeota archaeon]
MELSKEEKLMFEGVRGEGARKAMEILVALAEIYNAERMIEVKSAQIAGVSYRNLGDAGLEFLEEWAAQGAKVRVPSTLNPAGMDLRNWRILGFPEGFAEKQLRIIKAYEKMGVDPTCTCTPYLAGNLPRFGDHIAWSESSAVSFANSVIGARTNREGGPSALAAAVAGRTPLYGLHLDENRLADFIVEVRCPLKSLSDFGALGYLVGKKISGGVPFFRGVKKPSTDRLKALGAAMAASGSVALFHVDGVTPEAQKKNMLSENAKVLVIDDLSGGYDALNSQGEVIDFVALGCPHASIDEIEVIADLLRGKRVKSTLWITTSSAVKDLAEKRGLLNMIEESGAHVVADTCMIVAPIEELGFKKMATNAAKAAFYAPSHCKTDVRFGSLEKCINAAVSGRWE